MKKTTLSLLAALSLTAAACSPTIKIEPPDKPIVINMNIKIEHEVRIRVEKEADKLIQSNSDIF